MHRLTWLVLLLTAAACGDGAAPEGPRHEEVAFERLSLGSVCYGECAYTFPYDLPLTTVYDDGRVVTSEVQAARSFRVTLREGRVDEDAVAELAALAREAGLPQDTTKADFDGSTHFADGGGALLSGAAGGTSFRVEAPYLYGSGRTLEHGPTERRKALFALKQALERASGAAAEPLAAPRAALVAHSRPGATPDEQAWRGPGLAGLPVVADGTRCAVLSGEDLAAAESAATYSGFGTSVSDRGAHFTVRLRPLLPHERSCADLPLP